MRSKRFCCNRFSFGIWRKQTLRYWPIWGSYLAFWLLSMPQLLTSVPAYEPEMQTYRFGLALMQSLNGAAGGIALYASLIAVALYSYLYSSRSVNLFIAQLIVNFFWSPIFFNAGAYGFALLWLLLLWILVLWMILSFRKVDQLAALLQIPYLLWLTFAAYLNCAVWALNK